jgi:hypothetical protein
MQENDRNMKELADSHGNLGTGGITSLKSSDLSPDPKRERGEREREEPWKPEGTQGTMRIGGPEGSKGGLIAKKGGKGTRPSSQ